MQREKKKKRYGMAENIHYIYRFLFRRYPHTKFLLAGLVLLVTVTPESTAQDSTALSIRFPTSTHRSMSGMESSSHSSALQFISISARSAMESLLFRMASTAMSMSQKSVEITDMG